MWRRRRRRRRRWRCDAARLGGRRGGRGRGGAGCDGAAVSLPGIALRLRDLNEGAGLISIVLPHCVKVGVSTASREGTDGEGQDPRKRCTFHLR